MQKLAENCHFLIAIFSWYCASSRQIFGWYWNPERVRVGISIGTDRRTDRQTEGRTRWLTTIPSATMAAEDKNAWFRLRSIAYIGAKLWNENVCNFYYAQWIEFSTQKACVDDLSVLVVESSDVTYLRRFHNNILPNYVSLIHIVVLLLSEYNYLC